MEDTAKKSIPTGFRNLIVLYILTWFIPRPIYFAAGTLDITPQLFMGMVLFFDILINRRIQWSRVDIFLFGLLFVNFLCLEISSGISRAIESTGRIILELIATYMIGKIIAQHRELLSSVLRVILMCLTLLAPFLLLESLYRINVHCLLWGYEYYPHHEIRFGLTRAHGWTSHSIMLGITYAAFVAPALTLALDSTAGKFKNCLTTGLLLSGVYFSLSTGAWNVAFFALLLMFFDRYGSSNRKQKWKFIGFSVIAGYIVLWLVADSPPLLALMYHIKFLSTGWLYRWQLWERVIDVMPGYWLLGYGENLPEEFTGQVGWSIDNHYLVLLIQQGWLGLGTWLAFNYSVLKSNIKNYWIDQDDLHARLLRSFGFSIFGFIFSGLTVAFFSTAAIILFFFLGIASTAPTKDFIDE